MKINPNLKNNVDDGGVYFGRRCSFRSLMDRNWETVELFEKQETELLVDKNELASSSQGDFDETHVD